MNDRALLAAALDRLSLPKGQRPAESGVESTGAAALAAPQRGPALEVTLEAMCFSLRSGVNALERDDVKARIRLLSRRQLAEVCARVQRHKPHIAPAWTEADVKRLGEIWSLTR
jgi:hypothetical protein